MQLHRGLINLISKCGIALQIQVKEILFLKKNFSLSSATLFKACFCFTSSFI